MKSPQFWAVVALLVGAGSVLYVRGDVDRVPKSEPLSSVPQQLGSWQGTDVPLDAEVIEVLGKGVFLNRIYVPDAAAANSGKADVPAAENGAVRLFIGYFPTQRSGQSIHSPQNCLPGSGWVFESSGRTDVPDDHGRPSPVGEYVISNGSGKAEVLYWYRSHGRNIASDYAAKFYMLLDSIRYGRTDAALIRIVTSVDPVGGQAAAHQRAVAFAARMSPLLSAYIPD